MEITHQDEILTVLIAVVAILAKSVIKYLIYWLATKFPRLEATIARIEQLQRTITRPGTGANSKPPQNHYPPGPDSRTGKEQ
jgi:hypothetical protein